MSGCERPGPRPRASNASCRTGRYRSPPAASRSTATPKHDRRSGHKAGEGQFVCGLAGPSQARADGRVHWCRHVWHLDTSLMGAPSGHDGWLDRCLGGLRGALTMARPSRRHGGPRSGRRRRNCDHRRRSASARSSTSTWTPSTHWSNTGTIRSSMAGRSPSAGRANAASLLSRHRMNFEVAADLALILSLLVDRRNNACGLRCPDRLDPANPRELDPGQTSASPDPFANFGLRQRSSPRKGHSA
jgi:hypothetical protein